MKYLKMFEAFYDNEVLKFLYELDEIKPHLSSYEGWSQYCDYTYDDNSDYILVEFGASGYSDGFSHIMKIYHKEHAVGPIRVEEDESSYSPYGEGQSDKTEYYECYEDIIEEIKSHFGL